MRRLSRCHARRDALKYRNGYGFSLMAVCRHRDVAELFDVLIEAQTDLNWCADPSDLERVLVRLVDLEPRDDVAIPLQQKIAQLRMVQTRTGNATLTGLESVLPVRREASAERSWPNGFRR
jgi:hypothetical protein